MLALFEKITWVATLVVIACVGGAYGYLGGPSMTPAIERGSKTLSKEDFLKNISEEDDEIISLPTITPTDPKKKNKRPKTAKQTWKEVNKATLEGINNFNRAFKEAKKIKSEVVTQDGIQGLKIFDFGTSSIASTLGFEENDVIQGINGETLDFEALSSTRSLVPGSEAHQLYDRFLDQAQSGGVIRIDILRRGSPHQILFKVKN